MMKTISIGFKLILCIIIIIALNKEIFINNSAEMRAFYYFTIQSNILVVFSLIIFILFPNESRAKCLLRGVSLLAITLTGIIYNFVLYRIFQDWGTVGYTFSRTVTHVIAPLGFILDWLLFDKHNVMKWRDVFIWLIYPAVYCILSIYANIRYGFSLYFFLNISNGYGITLKWITILLCLLLIIGNLFVWWDKCIASITRNFRSRNYIQ